MHARRVGFEVSLLVVAPLLLLQALLHVGAELTVESVNTNPEIFSDLLLAPLERIHDGRQFIDPLGYVRVLDTSASALPSEDTPTRFDVFNTRETTRNIVFRPGTMCMLGANRKLQGPFPYDLSLMSKSRFNVSSKTVILVPGYRSREEDDWVRELRENWLKLDPDADVIQVSWSEFNRGLYQTAVAQTPSVGRQITIFLHYLATLSGRSYNDEQFLSNIHIIGHSLGAHIAGFVGQDSGGRLGRITGLDPAGPSFDQFVAEQRLDPSDAQLVEVMHTNAGVMNYRNLLTTVPIELLSSLPLLSDLGKNMGKSYSGEGDTAWFGIDIPVGHVDYYANNGRVQPGCSGLIHVCDHKRAHAIYTEMLKYELEMRDLLRRQYGNIREPEWQRLLRAQRLLAFKAENYDSFANGDSLMKHCPELTTYADELPKISHRQYEIALNACSVPMDLFSPIDQYKRELLMFRDARTGSKVRPKFYFKTLEDDRLIGDHWLIKFHVDFKSSAWDDELCSLLAELEISTGSAAMKSIAVDANKLKSVLDRKQPLSLAFIHADGPSSRAILLKLYKMIENKRLKSQADHEEIFKDLLRQVMPEKIELSVTKPKTPSFLNTVKDATLKIVKFGSPSWQCSLVINRVEVQPLGLPLAGDRVITGIYRHHSDGSNGGLVIQSDDEYAKDYNEFKDLSIGPVSTLSRTSVLLSLQGAVLSDSLHNK